MNKEETNKLADFPPRPPIDRAGGGGGDGDGEDGINPMGTPSLRQFMQLSTEMQAKVYRTAVQYRCRLQSLHIHATAEHLCKSSNGLGYETAVEETIEQLRYSQKISLSQADEWVLDPSKFSVADAIVWLYGVCEEAWNIADQLGLFDEIDAKSIENGERL